MLSLPILDSCVWLELISTALLLPTRTDGEHGYNSLSFQVWTSQSRHCRVQSWSDLKLISSCAYTVIIKLIITISVSLAWPPHTVSCKELKARRNKQAPLKGTLWLCRLQKSLGSSLGRGDSDSPLQEEDLDAGDLACVISPPEVLASGPKCRILLASSGGSQHILPAGSCRGPGCPRRVDALQRSWVV